MPSLPPPESFRGLVQCRRHCTAGESRHDITTASKPADYGVAGLAGDLSG